MPSFFKSLRYRLEAALVGLGESWVPTWSRRNLLTAAAVLGDAAYVVDYRGRKTALENLRAVFPQRADAWHRRTARLGYRSFARTMLDLFWTPNLRGSGGAALNVMEQEDAAAEDATRHSGAIWCCPHFGNFEWIALQMGWRGFPMMVVAQNFKNEALTPIFSRLRGASGHAMISSEGAMLRLFKNLKRGGHSSFLSDLTVPPDQAATVIRCFGRFWTSVTMLHAALAQRTGLPVIVMISIPQADGTYRLKQWAPRTFAAEASAHGIAQEIWDLCEPTILEHPEHWLWMYKHWRFLPPETDPASYPPYANRSGRFDRLLAREVPADERACPTA